jgi:hypothetical protein
MNVIRAFNNMSWFTVEMNVKLEVTYTFMNMCKHNNELNSMIIE